MPKWGHANAQSDLSVMYAKGKGVAQDNIYAHNNIQYRHIVWESGIALRISDDIAKKMTPADISKVQDLARECVLKKYKEC